MKKRRVLFSAWMLLTGMMVACAVVSTPTPHPAEQRATAAALIQTATAQAVRTSTPTPTFTLTPTPTPALVLLSPRDNETIPVWIDVTFRWDSLPLTGRQRFVVEINGEDRGVVVEPKQGPFWLEWRLPAGTYTWAVRLEEEREGRWEVLARSGTRRFRVELLPTPTPSTPEWPTPEPTPECPCCPPPTPPNEED